MANKYSLSNVITNKASNQKQNKYNLNNISGVSKYQLNESKFNVQTNKGLSGGGGRFGGEIPQNPTLGGTVGAGLTAIGKGLLSGGEAIGDTLQYGAALATRPFSKNLSDLIAKNAQFNVTDYLTNPAVKTYDKTAINAFKSTGIGNQVLQGVGQVGSMAGTVGVLGLTSNIAKTLIPSALQGYGSGVTQGLDKGASFGKAQLYGLGNASIQAGSEGLFGGIGGVIGKGALDDIVVNSVTKKIKSNLGKKLTEIGIKSFGEGLEENIAGVLDPILQRMTIDKNAQGYFADDNGKFTLSKAGQDFIVGAATSVLLQSPALIQKTNNHMPIKNKGNVIMQANAQDNTNINQIKKANLQETKAMPNSEVTEQLEYMTSKARKEMNKLDVTMPMDKNLSSLASAMPIKSTNKNIASLETTMPTKKTDNINYNKKDVTPYDFMDSNIKQNEINQNKTIGEKKIEVNETAIKTLIDEKNNTLKNIQSKIDQKKQELNNKKNKDTKIASQLKQQIAMLEKQKVDRETEYTSRINNLGVQNNKLSLKEYQVKEKRNVKVQQYRNEAKSLTDNISNWNDKKRGLSYEINTMERNIRDIVPDKKEAEQINNTYIKPITKHNAEIEHFITQYNDKISKLKLNSKESTAVQMLGEYKYNPETELRSEQVEKYIADNRLDREKIENSIETFRTIYDELITKANKVLKEQGYKEIEYRKGYFPHFIEDKPNSIIGKMAEKLGWKFNKSQLPTDIAGMTDIFKPGKTWFRNAQQRTGDTTDYNALKGFDNYIRGVSDIIYHTEDIQKLRALENEIRYQYSDKGIQEEIDKINNDDNLSLEEKEENINKVYDRVQNQMPNFVTELRRYTDNLANKKDIGDRNMEHRIGREAYNTMTNIHSRLSGNMVGLNIRSAMTNIIPITQAWSQISTKNMAKATQDTIKSYYKDDGFADRSTVLTNRTKQADRLYKTGIEKASDVAGAMFKGIDNLTTNIIVRGKYLENIDKGMNEQTALNDANEFAKNIIGGRDKGSLPTIFNQKNPLIKLFTSFQLEQANQFGYMFKDLPRDMKKEGMAKLTMAFVKMFFGAWLYNKIMKSVTGNDAAFSPIDLIEDNANTLTNKNLSSGEKIINSGSNVLENVPFVGGLIGGGRLPINVALPNIGTTITSASNLVSNDGDKKTAINNLVKELSKPVIYLVPPFGGGQIKKTVEGLSMYNKNLPTAGSYTSSGKLRFPVKTDLKNKIQAGLFGQYASKNAREYFDNNRLPLSDKQTEQVKGNYKESQKKYNKIIKKREYDGLVKKYKYLQRQGKDTTKIEKQILDLYKE